MKGLAILVFGAIAAAQTPTRLPFQCTADDLEAISQSCTAAEPCPVYVELTALEVIGPKVFVTGNLHTERSTLASLLVASEDGGRSWSEPAARIRTASLDQIQFIDFETGWISGQTVQGRPRDPFFLVTTDGGKSWRQRFVFDESHPGVIEQFWFESRSNGVLTVDRGRPGESGGRYEKCESRTGGESWSIAEINARPIRLARARAAGNPDWRLRPDPAAKVFRVEHREAGKWTSLAAFTLNVGECKTIEPKFDDAPPPAEEESTAEKAPEKKSAPAPARKKKKLL